MDFHGLEVLNWPQLTPYITTANTLPKNLWSWSLDYGLGQAKHKDAFTVLGQSWFNYCFG